jgi:hypothetical protein
MAIRVLEGTVGSGKTYYAVKHLIDKYFKWDTVKDEYIQTDQNVVIVTNLDGFKFGLELDKEIEKAGGLRQFFSVDYQKILLGGKRGLYIIDEAQRFFDRKFYDMQTFYFFQFHRHLGIDIYLLTQDISTLVKELQNLAEYKIRAVRRSHRLGKGFRYQWISGNGFNEEVYQTKMMKPEGRIFSLYKSMDNVEGEKIKSVPARYFVYVVGLCLLSWGLFRYVIMPRFSAGNRMTKVGMKEGKLVTGAEAVLGKKSLVPVVQSSVVGGNSDSVVAGNKKAVGIDLKKAIDVAIERRLDMLKPRVIEVRGFARIGGQPGRVLYDRVVNDQALEEGLWMTEEGLRGFCSCLVSTLHPGDRVAETGRGASGAVRGASERAKAYKDRNG